MARRGKPAGLRIFISGASIRCKRPVETKSGINHSRQSNLYDPDGTHTELMESLSVDAKPVPSSTAPPPR